MLFKDPTDNVVVVLGGPGFYCMDKIYRSASFRTSLAESFPQVEFVYPGTPFGEFKPPHMWTEEDRRRVPLEWLHLYWAHKARFNQCKLAPALHTPLPEGKTMRVAWVLRYGFSARTAATAFCEDEEMVVAVENIHSATVAVALPEWKLPVPYYFLPRVEEGDEVAVAGLLSQQWAHENDQLRAYVEHYRRSLISYFKPPQRTPLLVDPFHSVRQMEQSIVETVGDTIIGPRLLKLAA
jgi:hypothetical protein